MSAFIALLVGLGVLDMPPKTSINKMLEELEEASSLENSEVGEQWMSLVSAKTAADYGSEEFRAAFESELREQYEHLKSNFRVVKRTETRTVTYTDLEFVG